MTPSPADTPDMSVEEFEELARRAPETVTLEYINGKLKVKPVPDGDHVEIVMWLLRQCMQQRPQLNLYPDQGLVIPTYRAGRARPDGTLAPVGYFAGRGEWTHPEGVLMVVEVTSHDSDTRRRDHSDKRVGYATAGIPVYLLVDRDTDSLIVHSEPDGDTYRLCRSYKYGDEVALPAPVDITLDTEKLKDYAG
ncbi:Uma2 family endonuclease [Streptomyces wuyuanensis]|uniref:Uma2 family endonuclease n=1 Tax=Streptomyces wuyuanensis TaxID=1196353 RepID=UPI003803CF7C